MQVTSKQILRLLEADQTPDIRRSAVIVLGELGGRDAEVSRALVDLLGDDDPAVRLEVIRAAGKLKLDSALPMLAEKIKGGGEEAEQAAQAVARLGAKGTRALQDLMPKVAPGLRRYIASALASGGTPSAGTAAVAVLVDRDPGVAEAAARSLLNQIPTMSPAQKHGLAEQIAELLDGKTPVPAAAEPSLVRLLVALEHEKAAGLLWDRVLPPHSPETRASALQALGKSATAPGKEHLRRLFVCATDPDFRVAAPALMLLKALPSDGKTQANWLSLLKAPEKTARLMAIEKLGDRDTAEVAEALLDQLSHPDPSLRDAALSRLGRLDRGRQVLTKALLEAETPERAWSLAKAQAPFARDYPKASRDAIFGKACALLEAEDRRADALLYLLREIDANETRDRLEEKALAHRKKKAYDRALLYLRQLGRDPACGFGIRLELACCELKLSAKDLTAQAREDDPCVHHFAGLVRQHEEELTAALEKVKWLDPDDLYYLGFHFSEKEGASRKFGGLVLHLVVKRAGRTKLAQSARNKLRNEGLLD